MQKVLVSVIPVYLTEGILPQYCMSALPWSGFVCRAMSKLDVVFNLSPVECQIAAFRVTKTWRVSPVCREGVLPQYECRETSRNPLHV